MNGSLVHISLLTELILIWGSECYKYLAPTERKRPGTPHLERQSRTASNR